MFDVHCLEVGSSVPGVSRVRAATFCLLSVIWRSQMHYEDSVADTARPDWKCPRCRGKCNCSFCRFMAIVTAPLSVLPFGHSPA
jgi:hypothetical protein